MPSLTRLNPLGILRRRFLLRVENFTVGRYLAMNIPVVVLSRLGDCGVDSNTALLNQPP